MTNANYYKKGDYNQKCDICKAKVKASKTQLRWDGFLVCKYCFEIRNPQYYVKGLVDKQRVPNARPPQPPVYLDD